MPGPDLTPSQDLLLEALAARYRTGEHLWTFESRHAKTAQALEAKGLISMMHGIVEKTFRASLTGAGKDLCFSSGYTSPLEQKVKDLKRKKKGQKW